MGELTKIVLTACVTLAGGVILLIVTQVITRFIVDPLIDFRRLLGEVAYSLILNSNLLYNANATANTPEFQEARRQCRALASRLHAFSAAVPLYDILARIRLVPARTHVYDAARHLIGLSNTAANHPVNVVDQNYQRISQLLRIRVE